MFLYKNELLFLKQGAKALPVHKIAEGRPRPFYLYDIQGLREWSRFFVKTAGLKAFFAVKANSNKHILKAFQKEGLGADVVSIGEARLALKAGFSPKKIIFSGVGKSAAELAEAVQKSFFQINAESLGELKRLAEICESAGKSAALGLRINPNIDFPSHPYIKTGLSGHKFGFEERELAEALSFIRSRRRLKLRGLSMHLGSQIFDLQPLFQAIKYLREIYERLKAENFPLKVMDIGGGLGVNYQKPDLAGEKAQIKKFGQGLKRLLKGFEGEAIAEPGRLLSARFGLLCAKIEYIKPGPNKRFAILNSGMNHFLRPALYGAKHRVLPLKRAPGPLKIYELAGPICETGDILAKNQALPPLKQGDWLALADTGAYGFVMASRYNERPLAEEMAFDRGKKLS